ncbi:protocadherin beta-16-like [Seriola dumerili]|uniref:protocadherin beta-16-like n=1 Tax=Seriola dumerili TaxID=41447 RepID=UPI000BBEC754|nr:protocadherin beta-16-like [Seriola dumerili]
MKRGSVIGNIAKDLGLETGVLSKRRARIDTDGTDKRYCDINLNNGELIVADRIDREGLCGEKASCILKHELVLEHPLELHRISLHVQDINDNSPQFNEERINVEIQESADRGARFVIEEAHDADVGQNSVQHYSLKKNENFVLAVDGNTIELVLDKELDREKQEDINLLVTALDGGSPQRSGTVVIHVTVLDANDNAPVFSQAVYKASLPENSPLDTVVVTVSATDADEGVNGDVTYDFGHVTEDVKKIFSIDRKVADINDNPPVFEEQSYSAYVTENNKPGSTLCSVTARDPDWRQNGTVIYSLLAGEVNGAPVSSYLSVNGDTGVIHAVRSFDYEQFRSFKVHVMARDNGSPPLSSNVTVSVFISDVNDNSPQILYPAPEGNSFMTELVPKAAHGGSLVSKVIAVDADSGQNAWLSYHIVKSTDPGLFTIGLHSGEIRTQRDISESDSMKQNLIVAVKDNGQPSLSATSDINDNPPVFEEQSYSAYVTENNKPGSTLCSVTARDPDWRQNGTVIYSLLAGEVNGAPVSSYLSVNGDTGVIHAVRSFDYEQFRSFKVHVMARDNGSPPLSSNVTVSVFISDVNDNSPQILYPAPAGNSFMTELVPKAAHGGSLVSKVIAVDADSGQNAWLSYHIVKSTDPGLFTIGLHSGEIRTQRDISESDSMKQNLIVANSKLTSYLIIALVSVSTFFLTFIIIILGVRFCRRRKPRLLFDGAVAIPSAYLPPNYADVDGTGTLRSTYNYDAYLTTGSRTSDFKFVTSYNDNTLPADQTLKKSPSDFADAFGDVNESPEVGTCSMSSVPDL